MENQIKSQNSKTPLKEKKWFQANRELSQEENIRFDFLVATLRFYL
jgi:hypothetical protein